MSLARFVADHLDGDEDDDADDKNADDDDDDQPSFDGVVYHC